MAIYWMIHKISLIELKSKKKKKKSKYQQWLYIWHIQCHTQDTSFLDRGGWGPIINLQEIQSSMSYALATGKSFLTS